MLRVYGHFKFLNYFSVRGPSLDVECDVVRRQIQTSKHGPTTESVNFIQ